MDSLLLHVADVTENGEPVYEDQTEAQYKSGLHVIGDSYHVCSRMLPSRAYTSCQGSCFKVRVV